MDGNLFGKHRKGTGANMKTLSRRRFLKASAAVLAGSLAGSLSGHSAYARGRFKSDPFTLGVASGSPLPDSVILWTRLAPAPLDGGGVGPEKVPVNWEVASDKRFRKIVQSGTALAAPEFAHSVHVDVKGLAPGHDYFYRFTAGGAESQIGRTRTAPAIAEANDAVRFAYASCQQYEQGFYSAHRHMADEDLDFVIFLGDYIYESSWGSNHVRKHNAPEPRTLTDYRNRYALYKSDRDLQLCHTRFPWIVTWDDHEVDNDYASDRAEDLDASFAARRAAAYQAYYEHMPVRDQCVPTGRDMHLYQGYDFGRLGRFYILDDRQYRDYQIEPKPNRGGSNYIKQCAALQDDRRTMLGWQQEKWLARSLKESNAVWDIIAQQTLMAQVTRPEGLVWTDGWDGYASARRRLLKSGTVRGTESNTIVIGGDVHCNVVCDLKLDFDDPKAPIVATEICGTSITSEGPSLTKSSKWQALNPHMKFANGEKRGYVRVTLNKEKSHITLRAVNNEKDPQSGIYSLAEFIVERGRPGAIKQG